MSSIPITELKARTKITEVWRALGGGPIHKNRARAFWRRGDGYSVAVDPERGRWYDFRDAVGGDVVTLVETARQCDFREAIQWLADFTGMRIEPVRRHREADRNWATDLRWATWWAIGAEAFTEWALEELPPWHPERLTLTSLLRNVRLDDAALVTEFREWRRSNPEWTKALCQAGERSNARTQRQLARWLMRIWETKT
jgi:hypothetical protein